MTESSSWSRATLWSVLLGMSWTWCIGMFLPVLFLRDLGIRGFVVFAVPNVLGAAAMGWVLKSPGRSRQMVEDNAAACVWFSLATIVFHVFFTQWWIRSAIGSPVGYYLSGSLVVIVILAGTVPDWPIVAGVLTLGVSLAAFVWGMSSHDLPLIATRGAGSITPLPMTDLLYVAPVCLFGFLLCPYLDLTFHSARQALDVPRSRFAFTLGFAGFFLLMILFTLCYSGWLAEGFSRELPQQMMAILGVHWTLHSCYTVFLHGRRILLDSRKITRRHLALLILSVGVASALGAISRQPIYFHHLALGEIVYRCFLGFYALLFPAYVFMFVVPLRGRVIQRNRATLLRLLVALMFASPMYWMGFIERQTVWLIPGIVIAMLPRFTVPTSAGQARPLS